MANRSFLGVSKVSWNTFFRVSLSVSDIHTNTHIRFDAPAKSELNEIIWTSTIINIHRVITSNHDVEQIFDFEDASTHSTHSTNAAHSINPNTLDTRYTLPLTIWRTPCFRWRKNAEKMKTTSKAKWNRYPCDEWVSEWAPVECHHASAAS